MLEEQLEKQNDNLNQLLLDVVKAQKNTYKNLVTVFIVTVISLTTIICGMIFTFAWYESQFECVTTQEAFTKEVTNQEVSGESSSIMNIEGNQYNDNAIHNEDR